MGSIAFGTALRDVAILVATAEDAFATTNFVCEKIDARTARWFRQPKAFAARLGLAPVPFDDWLDRLGPSAPNWPLITLLPREFLDLPTVLGELLPVRERNRAIADGLIGAVVVLTGLHSQLGAMLTAMDRVDDGTLVASHASYYSELARHLRHIRGRHLSDWLAMGGCPTIQPSMR